MSHDRSAGTVIRRFAVVALISLSSVFAPEARAGEDGTLSLSPAVVMLKGELGQSTTQTLTLVNGTSRAFSFELVAQDVVTKDGKRRFVEAGQIPGSIAATAVFSPSRVDVAPGATATARVTFTLPPQTQQRAVVALFRGTNTVMSGRVPMTASLGTLLTFTASGEMRLATEALAVRPQSAAANLAVSQPCRNDGSEPLVARGVVAILDDAGALVGRSEMRPTRLLPGESSVLNTEYAGELEPGRYRLLVTYEYEGQTLSRSAEVTIP